MLKTVLPIRIIRFTDYERTQIPRLQLIGKYSSGKVLDIGYAQLPNSYFSSNVSEVCGIDIQKAVSPPEKYTDFRIVDLNCQSLPFPDKSFDTVVAGEMIEHINKPMDLIKEIYRVLKSNGRLLLSTPSPRFYLEIIARTMGRKLVQDHMILFDRANMKKHLEGEGFEVGQILGYNLWLPLLKIGMLNTSYKLTLPEILSWQQVYFCKKADGITKVERG